LLDLDVEELAFWWEAAETLARARQKASEG
jgi:hypothetical protein